MLTEIGAIRLFFFQACESRNWSEDFIYIASGADRSRLNLDLNQFASASVSSPVKTNKRIDVDPLGQVVPSSERINSRSGPDSKQRSYSRSDMSNLSAQLEHIRVNNHMVRF